MKTRSKSYGYYSISVSAFTGRLLHTNNERAFFLAQLQDLLSPRLLLSDLPAYKQLASCIDLLAFSIRDDAIQLVLFSIDRVVALNCITHALSRLDQYRSEYQAVRTNEQNTHRLHCKKLDGPHHALRRTIVLHARHEDWEFDRYSSIGFYLHDRRGDWMRIWRLSNLYDNDAARYEQLMHASLQPVSTIARPATMVRSVAS